VVFLAARSMLGFARWRLQRELWRRDVERLEARERRAARRPPTRASSLTDESRRARRS
jgi:hypothetical protein